MASDYKEQGTMIAGYEEKGPYHCEDCVHRIGDLCKHPAVAADPELKKKLVRHNDQMLVRIDLEKGCCKFVKAGKPA